MAMIQQTIGNAAHIPLLLCDKRRCQPASGHGYQTILLQCKSNHVLLPNHVLLQIVASPNQVHSTSHPANVSNSEVLQLLITTTTTSTLALHLLCKLLILLELLLDQLLRSLVLLLKRREILVGDCSVIARRRIVASLTNIV